MYVRKRHLTRDAQKELDEVHAKAARVIIAAEEEIYQLYRAWWERPDHRNMEGYWRFEKADKISN